METVLDLDKQQSEPQAEELQQSKKGDGKWNADKILQYHFAQPVRFVTYTGLKDLSVVRTKPYTVWATNADGELFKMPKLHILFAFPKEKMPDLKPYVKIRAPLKAENLQPIENTAERYHVDDELLKQAKESKSTVTAVTRTGHTLNGWIQHFDKYVLYMRIGEKMVIVYRHGLYAFTVAEQPEDAS